MKPIRVLLADDHGLVRAGIRALLQDLPGIEVVAETGEGTETMQTIQAQHPDVVLADIVMPGLNGLEIARRVTTEYPDIRVIILSMYANEEYVLQALHAGAVGYLLKGGNLTELELAIRAAVRGETFLSSAVAKDVVRAYLRNLGGETDPSEILALTPCQREILQLIATGHATEEIARKLTLSVRVVEMHRTQLMERLNIYDTAGLARYAIRMGLVPPEA